MWRLHFLYLMMEEKDKGNLTFNFISKQQFETMSNELLSRCGVYYDEQYLRRKYHRLCTNWQLFKDFRENYTAVGCDPSTGALIASDEQWNQWIKKNEGYKRSCTSGSSGGRSLKKSEWFLWWSLFEEKLG